MADEQDKPGGGPVAGRAASIDPKTRIETDKRAPDADSASPGAEEDQAAAKRKD